MAALIGRYRNKIDKKGRVSIPKQFRDALSGPVFAGIYVFPSFKYPAMEACGESFIKRIVESLDDLDLFSDKQDDIACTVLENAHELAYDSEGRVHLPSEILSHVNIGSEAMFVGRGSRFQIWEPSTYGVHNKNAFVRARTRSSTLSLRNSKSGENI